MPTMLDPDTKPDLSPGELARQDQESMGAPRTGAQQDEIDRLNKQFYKPDSEGGGGKGKPGGKLERLKAFGKKHKKKLWLGGAGLGMGFLGLMLVMLILGSLMLPHFMQNVMAWRFASAARAYRQMNNQIYSKKILIDSADESKWQAIERKYGQLKSYILMEKVLPGAIVRNMVATLKIDYEYTPRKNPLARPRMTAVIINGERIPLEKKSSWGIPFSQAGNNMRLSKSIDAALFKTMRGTSVAAMIQRTSAGSYILENIGYSRMYAWANGAKDYIGRTPREADVQLLRESYERVTGSGIQSTPTTPANQRAVEATKEALAEELTNDDKAAQLAESGEVSENVPKAMANALQDTKLDSIVKIGSSVNAVAQGACIIIDGSTEFTGKLTDSRTAAAQRQFLFYASAADQQKSGEVAGEAIKAIAGKLNDEGGVSRSNAQAMSSGAGANTDTVISPYANASGSFTLANVVFGNIFGQGGNNFADQVNKGLVPTCKVVASVGFGVVTGVAELVVGFFTGGSSEAATRAGTAALSRVIAEYLRHFTTNLVSKESARKLVTHGGSLAGATLLAKMVVSNYANLYYNGTAKNTTLTSEIEAGAEANATEVNRAMAGWTMTSEESRATRVESYKQNTADQQSLGFTERYLALTNPHSLLTRVGYTVMGSANTSFIGSALTSISKVFNPMAVIGMFSSISPKVSAAQTLDEDSYTRTNWAWTEKELKLIEEKETYYDFLENERILEESGKRAEIEEKYGKCTGPNAKSVGEIFASGDVVREENGTPDPGQGDCAPNKGGPNNPEYGDLVFRWRISVRSEAGLKMGVDLANPQSESSASTAANPSGKMVWPMPKSTGISDCYGSETKHHETPHEGLDMFGPSGAEIVAAADGKVVRAGASSGYGSHFVIIKHTNGMSTSYGHMKSQNVHVGDTVKAGDVIGIQGNEGFSSGDHLHFNVFPGEYAGSDKNNVNPLKYVTIPSSTNNPNQCSANATKNF